MQPAPNRFVRWLRTDGFYTIILVLLILFPHLVGWATGSSPFGVQRGERFIMSGSSVYWMAILIDIFALSVLVMSYNLMFGFTGVISFGHAMFFGLGGYLLGMVAQQSGLPIADAGGRLTLPFAFFTVDMNTNKKSLRKLIALGPEIACFGHGDPIMSGAAAAGR